MKIVCRKIISPATGEDLGDSSPWLKLSHIYTVLAINIAERFGIQVYVQTEHYDEPRFFSIRGFEFVNQNIPSSWVTVIHHVYDKKVMTMLPASWNYDDFFEDFDDQKPEAIELFNKEVELMYREEGLI